MNNFNDLGNLKTLEKILRQYFKMIFFLTLSGLCLGVIYSISLPNVYQSSSLLSPAEDSSRSSFGGLSGSLGGLASIAGVSMNAGDTRTQKGIKILQSYKFFRLFAEDPNVLPILLAAYGWDPVNNKFLFNEDNFDPETSTWKDGFVPSYQLAFKAFNELFFVSQDEKTGFINIYIKSFSPILSKEWLERIIFLINEEVRKDEVNQAKRSIEYLNIQISKTSYTEIKEALSDLIQSQIKIVMLAESSQEFIFDVIDPPFIPEFKKEPFRALIVLISGIFSLLISMIIALFRFLIKKDFS